MNSAHSNPSKKKIKKTGMALTDKKQVTNESKELDVDDGVKYININGRTELGKLLANFAFTPFVHPYFGPFNCMEGFWHYIRNKEKDDRFRNMDGSEAKKLASKLTMEYVKDFRAIIEVAMFYKVDQNPRLKELLLESTLPFVYYYRFGPGDLAINPRGHDWMVKMIANVRTMIQEGNCPLEIDYSRLCKKS